MDELRKEEAEIKVTALKKVVKEVLLGLQVLHRAKVIHRDIKPKNVLIDSGNNARLADFGISRRLEDDKSTVYTGRAGTKCWEAVETLEPTEKTGYKRSSDVQVAGMLVYYILSDGKHPFKGNVLWEQEAKIREGNYSLDEVDDVVAKDLIERMISKVQKERPTVDEALNHPYFWDDAR
ncbi:serine/threonine-protein kinase/endoribonuclease ire-1-like [Misgurnus anguillicaudatus]|uniref:serine/threonine-protein kinase/endoribonuclease ire-1-like n=1 Tax=Misgurnus anguillicaudatus TaxID=75329 RepID=UPI003CCF1C5F